MLEGIVMDSENTVRGYCVYVYIYIYIYIHI